jgi:uncharacterized protein YjbJ (UPF0337 family)
MNPTLREGELPREEVAVDKAEGKMKEAYGALVGDEAKKAEGRAQQRKAEAEAEAEQGRRPGGLRSRPSRPRRSAIGRRARAASWATWAAPCRSLREEPTLAGEG